MRHYTRCSRFAIAAGADRAATYLHPGRLTLWHLPDWTPIVTNQVPEGLNGFALSADGRELAASGIGGVIYWWELEGAKLECSRAFGVEEIGGPLAFRSAPIPTLIAAAGTQLYEIRREPARRTLRAIRTYAGHGAGIRGLNVDGSGVISGGRDHTARLWQGETAETPTQSPAIVSQALTWPALRSADGKYLVLCESNGAVALLDHPHKALQARVSGDWHLLHVSATAENVLLIDYSKAQFGHWKPFQSDPPRAVSIEHWGDGEQYLRLEASPEGETVAGSRKDGTVSLWSTANGRRHASLIASTNGFAYAATFSADGTRLATAGNDGSTRVWDVSTGKLIEAFHDTFRVFCAAITPDGRLVASAGNSGRVRIWDIATRQLLNELPPSGTDSWVSFSPDGRTLARASGKGVQLWNTASWRPLCELDFDFTGFTALRFDPDGTGLWAVPFESDHSKYWRAPGR